jgi:hypothetical protein
MGSVFVSGYRAELAEKGFAFVGILFASPRSLKMFFVVNLSSQRDENEENNIMSQINNAFLSQPLFFIVGDRARLGMDVDDVELKMWLIDEPYD